jgi:hypothetical protein
MLGDSDVEAEGLEGIAVKADIFLARALTGGDNANSQCHFGVKFSLLE